MRDADQRAVVVEVFFDDAPQAARAEPEGDVEAVVAALAGAEREGAVDPRPEGAAIPAPDLEEKAAAGRYTDRAMQEPIADRLRAHFRCHPDGLAAVYLYGSRARGTERAGSDVDLGLLFAETPPEVIGSPRFQVEEKVEKALRLPVETVTLNSAPPDLVHRVLRDGILVLETDRSARIRFEVAKRNEYFDMLAIWEEYRRPRGAER